ncbi:hypothetical protein [Streptomyces sp. N35]|uniref:hypothetical protein n=1 Tax=Streptomyces sp. N35 TaxID=2795730 RepID=UPI0018F3A0A1|nr:hypothetical protein [Streptomyces sp. N35]
MATTGTGLTFADSLRHLSRRPYLLVPLVPAAMGSIWTQAHLHIALAVPAGILLTAVGTAPMVFSLERLKAVSWPAGM